METTYIFGHKKPDTDSVTSSIALSYLKNRLNEHTTPAILGEINNETKFVLDYFHIDCPNYLNNVKLQIKDVAFTKGHFLNHLDSIYSGHEYITQHNIGVIPVINDQKQLLGIVSMKDIAKYLISGSNTHMCTSYDNILNTLDGESLLRFEEKIEGNILIPSYRSTTFLEQVEINHNTILIVGDRHSIIEYAVTSGAKMIILTNNSYIKEEHLQIAKENKVNIIKTSLGSLSLARLIGLCNYIEQITLKDNIICLNDTDYVNDFLEIANSVKYSNYPVLDQNKICLGNLRLTDIANRNKKKVILVDHNEYEQSVDGLDEAEIIEIVDHHKIGNIGTSLPINFRNMPVGSTNTIVYLLYKENNIEIPKEIAGLMLSGIISDTLLLKSPTTTEMDADVLEDLAKIANIDYEEYGLEMFRAGSSLKGKTKEEILYTDFKNFNIEHKKVGIGQITTLDIEQIESEKNGYIELLNTVAKQSEYDLVALFVTDIIHNGSYLYYNETSKKILQSAFHLEELEEGTYLDGCISRKKQMLPSIINALEKK